MSPTTIPGTAPPDHRRYCVQRTMAHRAYVSRDVLDHVRGVFAPAAQQRRSHAVLEMASPSVATWAQGDARHAVTLRGICLG